MISKFQTFISSTGLKDAKVQKTSEKVNELDRIHLLDGKGSQVTIESGVIYRCLIEFAKTSNLTPENYLAEFRKLLEEKQDEEVNKSQ